MTCAVKMFGNSFDKRLSAVYNETMDKKLLTAIYGAYGYLIG